MIIDKSITLDLNRVQPLKVIRIHQGDVNSVNIVINVTNENKSVDLTGKAKGRGAYLCRNPQCLKLARKNNGLNRAFKMNVTDETYQELERQLSE